MISVYLYPLYLLPTWNNLLCLWVSHAGRTQIWTLNVQYKWARMLGPKEKFQQRGPVIPTAPGDALIISPESITCMCVVCVCVCVCGQSHQGLLCSLIMAMTFPNTPLTFLGWAAKYFYEKIFSRIITKSNFFFFFFWLCWVFWCEWAFSSCSEQRLLSSCRVWVFCWGSFSCCGAWVLEPGHQ